MNTTTTQDLSKEEKFKQYQREWYLKNKERLREANRESARRYRAKHNHKEEYKQRQLEHSRAFREKNKNNQQQKQKQRELNSVYFSDPKNKVKLHVAYVKRREVYKKKYKNQWKEYSSRRDVKIKRRERVRDKYRSNIQFRLRRVLRSRFIDALKYQGSKCTNKAEILLGCSILEFKQYIESLWSPGMSWVNHTLHGWHIDHIKPVNIFDLTDPEQQKQCFHYSNLRPLWAADNLSRPKDGSDIV